MSERPPFARFGSEASASHDSGEAEASLPIKKYIIQKSALSNTGTEYVLI